MKGYWNKIIRINLTKKTIIIEEKDDLFYRTYLGGRGIIAYYILNEIPPNTDPLGPDNKLIFAPGLVNGVAMAGMSRLVVGAKSPLTGGFGQAESGGFWGPEFKLAGYDALIIEGKATKPVYIAIINDEISIIDASSLWGKDTGEVQEYIRQDLGDKRIRIASIGQGGENLVRFACIINDLNHACGRCGLGCVMGSKNLKAIAVRGTKIMPHADIETVMSLSKSTAQNFMKNFLTRSLREYGTSSVVDMLNAGGMLPTTNFLNGTFQQVKGINSQAYKERIFKKNDGCFGCAIRCKRVVEVHNDRFSVDPKYGGPEYETIGSFGSLCENNDIESIAKANELCNRYSLDTISTGMSIGFAMECYKKGFITKADLGGEELCYGDSNAILRMINKIAFRKGIGDILAEGTYRAAEIIGYDANKCNLCVKNQELPLHDPRGKVGVGIGYAISDTGADHMVAIHDGMLAKNGPVLESLAPLGILASIDPMDLSSKKTRAFMYSQLWWSFLNMAGICIFVPAPRGCVSIKDIVALIKAVTGWETSVWELMKAGERSINMARVYNNLSGFNINDDILPERLFTPIEHGNGIYIQKERFYKAICDYYDMMGWNENGMPRRGKLLELDLDWVSEMINGYKSNNQEDDYE